MRHTFQEAAGAAVCALLAAVLLCGSAFADDHAVPTPAHAAVAVPAHAQPKAAVAAPHHAPQPAMAIPQVRELAASHTAAMHSNLMEKLRGAYEIALDLLSGNHTHLLSDIQADLLSKNVAELLSGNKTKLLSDNNPNVLSGNETELLSGNKPEILSGNQMPILSGNRVSILSNLKIEIHINNSGNNNGNHAPMPVGPGGPRASVRPSAGAQPAPGLGRPAPETRRAPDAPARRPRE